MGKKSSWVIIGMSLIPVILGIVIWLLLPYMNIG